MIDCDELVQILMSNHASNFFFGHLRAKTLSYVIKPRKRPYFVYLSIFIIYVVERYLLQFFPFRPHDRHEQRKYLKEQQDK